MSDAPHPSEAARPGSAAARWRSRLTDALGALMEVATSLAERAADRTLALLAAVPDPMAPVPGVIGMGNRYVRLSRLALRLSVLIVWLEEGNRPLRRADMVQGGPAGLSAQAAQGMALESAPEVKPQDAPASGSGGGGGGGGNRGGGGGPGSRWREAMLREFATRPIEDILAECRDSLTKEAGKLGCPEDAAQVRALMDEIEAVLAVMPPAPPEAARPARPRKRSQRTAPAAAAAAGTPADTPAPSAPAG